MRADHQHARVDAESLDGLAERNRAAVLAEQDARRDQKQEQESLSRQTFALRFVG
jgi:hypothetical protein